MENACGHSSCTAGCWVGKAIRTASRYVKRGSSGRVEVGEHLRMARPFLLMVFGTTFGEATLPKRVSL